MGWFKISADEYQQIKEYEAHTRDKAISRRLKAIMLRYEGKTIAEIGKMLELHPSTVTNMCARYKKEGLKEYARNKYTSHNRNLNYEQEENALKRAEERAKKGQSITVREIREELERELGRKSEVSYVYKVLKRHEWRKVMPRSRHPKAADEAAVEAAKKLRAVYWMRAKSGMDEPSV